MAGKKGDQFPEGNRDGTIFQEYGFALNNFNGNKGWAWPTMWNPYRFHYQTENLNCDTPVAMGEIELRSAKDGSPTLIDNSFGFNKVNKGRKRGGVAITYHHSSSAVGLDGSTVICTDNCERL